jgi:hypothetical protein
MGIRRAELRLDAVTDLRIDGHVAFLAAMMESF